MVLELQFLGAVKPQTIRCNIPTTVDIPHFSMCRSFHFDCSAGALRDENIGPCLTDACDAPFHFVVASDPSAHIAVSLGFH